MKRAKQFSVGGPILLGCITGFTGCSGIHGAPERPADLRMAALKGFEGPVYYVGSEGDFSYFRAGTIFHTRYKARTSKLQLPRTFSLGQGKPYRVTEDMVPAY
jgi:hypothetical protein